MCHLLTCGVTKTSRTWPANTVANNSMDWRANHTALTQRVSLQLVLDQLYNNSALTFWWSCKSFWGAAPCARKVPSKTGFEVRNKRCIMLFG